MTKLARFGTMQVAPNKKERGVPMPVVRPMENITIPESLGLSVLGLIIVFLVLVFLMVIIYIMTAVARKGKKKS